MTPTRDEAVMMTGRALCWWTLSLCLGCGPAAAPEPPATRSPDADRVGAQALLAHVGKARGEPQLEQDHLFSGRLSAEAATVAVLIASSPSRRYVSVFEADAAPRPDGLAAATVGPEGFRPVLEVDFERHGRMWMVPDAPARGDLDGDGHEEVLLTFDCVLGDRISRTAIVLAKRAGSWSALGHPSVIAFLRSHPDDHGAGLSIYQDDKMSSMRSIDHATTLYGLHSGGDWRLVARPDGSTSLLATAIVADGGTLPDPHRVALAMFRLTDAGFVPDPDWNGARAHVTAEPTKLSEVDCEQIVAEGFRRPR